jgi:hypothetical protein
MTADDEDDEQRRKRLYNNAALAQSFVPQGVADLLKLNAQGRAQARAQWRARPRRERALFVGLMVFYGLCGVALFVGLMTANAVVLGSVAIAFFGSFLATTVNTVVAEVRRGRRSAQARREHLNG